MRALTWLLPLAMTTLAFSFPAYGQDQEWSDVEGRVVWGGKIIPVPGIINVPNLPPNVAPPVDNTWEVHPKNRGLKAAFVWLEPAKKADKLPIHPMLVNLPPQNRVLDHVGLMLLPSSLGMRKGDPLVLKSDGNFPCAGRLVGNPPVNPGQTFLINPGAQVMVVAGLLPDRIPVVVESNIYPWIRSTVRVFDHPYFAVTDSDGKFSIPKAPAGEWQLKVWHAGGGWAGGVCGRNGQSIQVKAGKTNLGDIAYPDPNE